MSCLFPCSTVSLSPDPVVRSALEFKVQISSSYKRTFDSTTSSDKLVYPIQQSTSNLLTSAKRYTQAKRLIKQQRTENLTSYHYDKIQSLLTQGSLLKLLHLEQTDAS